MFVVPQTLPGAFHGTLCPSSPPLYASFPGHTRTIAVLSNEEQRLAPAFSCRTRAYCMSLAMTNPPRWSRCLIPSRFDQGARCLDEEIRRATCRAWSAPLLSCVSSSTWRFSFRSLSGTTFAYSFTPPPPRCRLWPESRCSLGRDFSSAIMLSSSQCVSRDVSKCMIAVAIPPHVS